MSRLTEDEPIEKLYNQEDFDSLNKHLSPLDHDEDQGLGSQSQSTAITPPAIHASRIRIYLSEFSFSDSEKFVSSREE